jgi:hypothetical protein
MFFLTLKLVVWCDWVIGRVHMHAAVLTTEYGVISVEVIINVRI